MILLSYLKGQLGIRGSRLGLSTNDVVTVENLLYGLMLASGNDAAIALSEFIGGSVDGFASMMNKKAADLGLESSHFITPHGLDEDEHYTTAYELAKIADYALQNETFAKIVRTPSYTVNINGRLKSLHNTNELLGYLDGIYGVKTGFTNGANRCLVTSCKRGSLDIICVVLGCDTKKNRTLDSINLINYTFNNFSIIDMKDLINKDFQDWNSIHSNSFYINKGTQSSLKLYLNESQIPFNTIAVHNNSLENISTSISYTKDYEAPVFKNTVIGKMDVRIGDDISFSVDILNENIIEKKDVFYYLNTFIKNYFNYFDISA